MNNIILKRCLDELSSEAPRLDYIRGMLETLIELQGASRTTYEMSTPLSTTNLIIPHSTSGDPETMAMDAFTRAQLSKIKTDEA